MKKTTIALFTAAAIGGSSMALAADVTGPSIFGRVDIRAADADSGNFDIKNGSSKLGFSGGASDLAGGLDASYYIRGAYDDGGYTPDYYFVNLGNDDVRLIVGHDDDLVYQYTGAHTDVFRGQQGGGYYADTSAFGAYATSANFKESAKVKINAGPIQIGGFAETDADGLNRTQVGATGTFGMATFGVVMSDQEENDNGSEVFFGTAIDAGFTSLRATVADRNTDEMQVALAAVTPISNNVNLTLGFDEADSNGDNVIAMVLADLGGGLSVYGGGSSGDGDDNITTGVRFTF
jgi:hypothetical protein